MKNSFLLFIAFLIQICFANAQMQNNILPERNRKHFAKPMQADLRINISPIQSNKKLFGPKTLTWTWDTIITYDVLGLLQRLTNTFDINGNVLIELTDAWQTNAWVNDERWSATYDANGNTLTELLELWQAQIWVNDWRETYTYDANGNRLTSFFEVWQTNAWVNSSRRTYTYDANGNWMTYLYEQWQANAWVKDTRGTNT